MNLHPRKVYWTLKTQQGELLPAWLESTRKEVLEAKKYMMEECIVEEYEEMKGWKPVKVQLMEVTK